MRRSLLLAATLALLAPFPMALAEDKADHVDWPCVQRRVPKLSVGQMWDGPSITGASRADQDVRKLVATLASRRIPIDDALKALKEFADKQPPAEKDARLTAVFAGLFSTVDQQRSVVLDGIVHFQQRQRQRSAEIEREGERITELKKRAETDAKAKDELKSAGELFDWNVRVFQERQSNMPLACEIPVLIEERLFAISREIRGLMGS
jgi:hypothetical protein